MEALRHLGGNIIKGRGWLFGFVLAGCLLLSQGAVRGVEEDGPGGDELTKMLQDYLAKAESEENGGDDAEAFLDDMLNTDTGKAEPQEETETDVSFSRGAVPQEDFFASLREDEAASVDETFLDVEMNSFEPVAEEEVPETPKKEISKVIKRTSGQEILPEPEGKLFIADIIHIVMLPQDFLQPNDSFASLPLLKQLQRQSFRLKQRSTSSVLSNIQNSAATDALCTMPRELL